jgi:RraA family protein
MADKPRSAHLHPGPGFRVRVNFPRPDPDVMRELGTFPTPDISDQLNRLYAVSPGIKLLTADRHRLAGPACTVKVFPGDNLMVHKALDVLEPGDVVVVDAGASDHNAVLGDLISMKAKHRGAAGFVVDGFVRDLPNIVGLDFPVFARGTTPIGPLHRGPGEINCAVCCGGVVVNAGDIIVGDAMGVVVVPQGIAAELLERLKAHEVANEAYLETVRSGVFSNAWVDKILTELECPLVRGPTRAEQAAEGPAVDPTPAASDR